NRVASRKGEPCMRAITRWLRVALAGVGALVLVLVGVVYLLSERELRRTYAVPAETTPAIPSDSAALARGAHLVHTVGTCVLCHGADLGGTVYIEGGPLGLVTGPESHPRTGWHRCGLHGHGLGAGHS